MLFYSHALLRSRSSTLHARFMQKVGRYCMKQVWFYCLSEDNYTIKAFLKCCRRGITFVVKFLRLELRYQWLIARLLQLQDYKDGGLVGGHSTKVHNPSLIYVHTGHDPADLYVNKQLSLLFKRSFGYRQLTLAHKK